MPKLPATLQITQTTPNGVTSFGATLTDGDGTVLGSTGGLMGDSLSALDVIRNLRGWARELLAASITPADLPASFTVQIGLDASLRELDLL